MLGVSESRFEEFKDSNVQLHRDNREDHQEMLERLRLVENQVAINTAKLAGVAGLSSIVGGIAVAVVHHYI